MVCEIVTFADNSKVQGGRSPGGSAWGGTFEDEFHPELRHDRMGILSMANSGPNTNATQL